MTGVSLVHTVLISEQGTITFYATCSCGRGIRETGGHIKDGARLGYRESQHVGCPTQLLEYSSDVVTYEGPLSIYDIEAIHERKVQHNVYNHRTDHGAN